jgi:hypothetical protein
MKEDFPYTRNNDKLERGGIDDKLETRHSSRISVPIDNLHIEPWESNRVDFER